MKQFWLPVFFTLFSISFSSAQSNNKKADKAYRDAMLQLRDGFIKDAIPLLGKAIEYDNEFLDAYLSLAGVYGELKDYKKAIHYYEQVQKKDSAYFAPFLLSYSINLAGQGRFEDALLAVNNFLLDARLNEKSKKSAQYRKECYAFAIEQKNNNQFNYDFNPQNLGDEINSKYDEYFPSLTIDDSIFVFTRRHNGREDFFQSTIKDNRFSPAEIINGSINNERFKGAINISQDGEWLIFAGDFGMKGYGSYDLYISYNTPTGWSEPQNLGENINSEFWETSPSLSPDKNALYFTSNRPGGFGGSDLYVSYRQKNGRWGKAINLGPKINTAGDEMAPFIHADNNSLYFTSNGHKGYGGTDLYLLKRIKGNEWHGPVNLGYPINTIENEGALFISANGKDAYYSSDRADSRGGLDLYRFELRPGIRPAKTLYVKGYILNSTNMKGVPATVSLTDNASGENIQHIQTDETGFYFITLPVGKDYTFSVNRKGFLFYTDVYALSNKAADSTYTKNILLKPIEKNEHITLKNIQFTSGTATLENPSFIELDKLIEFMQENENVSILIAGHTDNTGTEALNKNLSEQRAKAVAGYLLSKGISAKRITTKGFGATRPIAENNTEAGKALNRRTEIYITAL